MLGNATFSIMSSRFLQGSEFGVVFGVLDLGFTIWELGLEGWKVQSMIQVERITATISTDSFYKHTVRCRSNNMIKDHGLVLKVGES